MLVRWPNIVVFDTTKQHFRLMGQIMLLLGVLFIQRQHCDIYLTPKKLSDQQSLHRVLEGLQGNEKYPMAFIVCTRQSGKTRRK